MLTKSNYLSGMQCPRKLWLEKRQFSSTAKPSESFRVKEGTEIGSLARKFFADAVLVPLGRAEEMEETTRSLISSGHKTISEATFIAEGCSCSADIVRIHLDGLDVIEVKSTTSPKNVHTEDLAFQCYVIQKAGYTIRKTYIMHLNKEYVRHGELDLNKLFTLTEIPVPFKWQYGGIANEIQGLKAICERRIAPGIELGCHCEDPYPCPYQEQCRNQLNIPKDSVFEISCLSAKKKYDFYKRGLITRGQVLREEQFLLKSLSNTSKALSWSDEILVDQEAITSFLANIRFPLYHLDYETIQHAVPQYEGTSPFEQVPTQYSLHVRTDWETEELQHREFLGQPASDWRRALAESLCACIPFGAQTMAYNKSFEQTVLRKLAKLYPDLADHLNSMADNMLDLMVPFRKGWVVSADMYGSYSIKAVLPALCKDDPELDYSRLEGVHNGTEAMEAFAKLLELDDPAEINALREQLLEYCGLDTLAMDKILVKLYQYTTSKEEEKNA